MSRASQNKLYRNFNKGLVTEAGPLTYPEDASVDELNTVISLKGNRSRRLGIDFESGGSAVSTVTSPSSVTTTEFLWKAVANDASLNFLCIQVGSLLHFFDADSEPFSSGHKPFTVSLSAYLSPTGTIPDVTSGDNVQFASGKGFLFVVHPFIEPLCIEYDPDTNTISVLKILIQMRDFDGVDDGLANDEEPITLTDEHIYNLRNQGWVPPGTDVSAGTYQESIRYDQYLGTPVTYNIPGGISNDPINQYYNVVGRYPGNNKQWWIARADTDNPDTLVQAGDFQPNILRKLFSGNNRAPKGHYILSAFTKDRNAVAHLTTLPLEVIDDRPISTAFFSGRIWFACGSTVYFSQVLTTKYKSGLCYQEADPTAEDISDLIATDGGVIPVPEANKIIRIVPHGGGVLVYAINGVWSITGTSSGFSALDISVNKVSPVGCVASNSVVETDEAVYWWSEAGILGMAQKNGIAGPIDDKFDRTNISQTTIQTFYAAIKREDKQTCKGLYDAETNRIHWLYGDDSISAKRYNKVLTLDLTLTAFYPWEFSVVDEVDPPYVKGFFISLFRNLDEEDETRVKYIAMKDDNLYFCEVGSRSFTDWFSENDVGVTYDSYVEAGFELFNDAMRHKNVTYLFAYFRRTETEYDEITGELNDPSSCFLTTKFDWSSSGISGKWTTPVQVYRFGRIPVMADGDFETGFATVVTKNKVRGNGKALQFRFGTDEAGRNFDLLGWSIAVTGGTAV